ncbi:MAG: tRNA (adenosine(37)-N6)-dimethylallyltransferase MiaA [Oscillospiraceae bacterium]
MQQKIPLIVVVGPTASGKTALGIALAKQFNGEVVSADSMQIYKQMDIATAKPSLQEMEGIPHHLMNLVEPSEPFSLAQYVTLAQQAIEDIHSRGKQPVIVGGTGLYHISLGDSGGDEEIRENLLREAHENGNRLLLEKLRIFDPETAEKLHENNLLRIIRAIEVYQTTGIPMSEWVKRSRTQETPYCFCMIGLNFRDRQKLYDRINLRVDWMIEKGLLDETREMLKNPLQTSAQAIGYKELKPYLIGEEPLSICVDRLKQSTRRYAKRQLTWFRRDERIHWIFADEETNFAEVLKKSINTIEKSNVLC